MRFTPIEKKGSEFLSDTDFLFEDEKVAMAVGEGFMYTDGNVVVLFVASATTNPKSDDQVLQEMKIDLEKKIAEIKATGDQEEIERAYLNLQKLTADIQLLRIKKKKSRFISLLCCMANTKQIRTKIKSVKNLQKIIKALEIVSTVKLQKLKGVIGSYRAFMESFLEVLKEVRKEVNIFDFDEKTWNPNGRRLLIVVTSDRGLC